MSTFAGIWPALVTPITEEGEVNVSAAESLIEALLATGIGGLYVCGGTGEGVLLPPRVRRQMAEVAIGAVSHAVPVMVHVGTADTPTAVELARHAASAGADAVSAVPPFYYSYPHQAIVEHYRAIATASSSLPLFIYYIPGATGVTMTPEQILDICAVDGVAGLKYTAEDLGCLERLLILRDPARLTIFAGPDPLFLACYALGVEGAIGTTYNVMPRLYIDIMRAASGGDLATARRLQHAAGAIIKVLRDYEVIPATKALLTSLGFQVGPCVRPMPRIEGERAASLRRDAEAAGLVGLLKRHALYGPAGDPMRGRLA